jgi:DNA-directed RNA polymerase subunit RPC12/RpoP
MEGIIWLVLALVLALVSLGAVLAGMRRRPPSPDENPGHCSRCETPMSLRRVPLLKSQALLGEWVCPHCGSRIRSGRGVSGTAV